MATTIWDAPEHVVTGSIDTGDLNTAPGCRIIPNDDARRIIVTDCWIRPAGTASAGTTLFLMEDKPCITCTSISNADFVTITWNKTDYVYTAATTAVLSTRVFTSGGGDTAVATSLAAGINSAAYGIPGLTAIASTDTVTLARSDGVPTEIQIASSAPTKAKIGWGGTTYVAFAQAQIADATFLLAGATGATATLLNSEPATRYPVKFFCKTRDLATTTAVEFMVKYKVL